MTGWICSPAGKHELHTEFGKKISSKFVSLEMEEESNDNVEKDSLLIRWVLSFGGTEVNQYRIQWRSP
jgi:hypothetical protein